MIYHPTLAENIVSSFKILPRELGITTSDTLTIKNQSENKDLSIKFKTSSYDSNNILTVSFSINVGGDDSLEEGVFYEIELTKNVTDAVLWRGVMFVSDQEKEDYTINDGEFKEKTSTNEYIILN